MIHFLKSENIESKAALRSMDISENIEMLVNHKYGFPKPQIVYPHTYSNHLQKQKELEGLGDNISCISRSDDTKTSASDMHNLSRTSVVIDGSPADRKAINDQFSFHYRGSSHFDKVTTNHPWRPNRESSQAVADFSIRNFFHKRFLWQCQLAEGVSFRFFISWQINFFMIMDLKFMCLFLGRAF